MFVLVWFQPQKLFIDDTVNEPVPVAQSTSPALSQHGPLLHHRPASPRPATPPTPVVLATGRLHSGEHHTEGTAEILQLSDGRRFLRFDDLRTSNGPVVKVWLTTTPSDATDAEISVGRHLDLGGLKGNIGDQNYALRADTDLSRYRAVVIWCDRFNVSFGAAPLTMRS
ncbi:MAG: hypothetical protein QOJ03_1254 [Frankiaceae bacterium]|nr:hypothetical protein [Frankiaceae bacterium]